MDKDFRPELMTRTIGYCLSAECPRAASCLRRLAYEHAAPFHQHYFLDPRGQVVGERCPDYLSNRVYLQAWGFRRASFLLRRGQASDLRARLRYEFGWARATYYKYYSGGGALDPEEQQIVREVFAELGVTQPELFDRYEEAYYLPD